MPIQKTLSAALLCLGTSVAFCQSGPGPNPPPNVYKDYEYKFFNLPNGATGNLTVINNLDVVAGTYYPTDPCCSPSASGAAYLRYPDGKITVFTIANADAVSMTVSGLNDRGELLGHYQDKSSGLITGFIRYADGKIKTFSLGGATTNTIPTGINEEGDIFGVLADNNSSGPGRPFLRYPDGQYLTYSVPGSNVGTRNINNRGVALGSYFCSNSDGGVCGFYGKPGGNVETFDNPPYGLIPLQINNRNVIGGYTYPTLSGQDYFFRKPDGKTILFGLYKIANIATVDLFQFAFNDEGEAIGAYSIFVQQVGNLGEADSYTYDIVRSPGGKISYYDPPNSPGTLLGNVINDRGVIAGRVVETTGNGQFLLVPKHCK